VLELVLLIGMIGFSVVGDFEVVLHVEPVFGV